MSLPRYAQFFHSWNRRLRDQFQGIIACQPCRKCEWMPRWRVISFGSGRLRKAAQMIRTALAAGVAIGVGFGGVGLGGAAMAQSLRMPLIPQAARALLVDHDNDKHQKGKNKHRDREDEGEDEDRGRRSSVPGAWRDYAPPPNYYYPPPPLSYSAPYAPAVPAPPPPVPARPSARTGTQPSAPGPASTDSNRRDGAAGSSAPSIQWVDPPPAR